MCFCNMKRHTLNEDYNKIISISYSAQSQGLIAFYMVHNNNDDDENNENDNDDDSSTKVNTVPILKQLAISTYKMHEKKTDIIQDKHNNNTLAHTNIER